MTIIKAKDFQSRGHLEAYVRSEFGNTTEKKADVEIRGTMKELAALRLSGTTTFFGIKCVASDAPDLNKSGPPKEKVNRGRQTSFGINGNLKDNPNN